MRDLVEDSNYCRLRRAQLLTVTPLRLSTHFRANNMLKEKYRKVLFLRMWYTHVSATNSVGFVDSLDKFGVCSCLVAMGLPWLL